MIARSAIIIAILLSRARDTYRIPFFGIRIVSLFSGYVSYPFFRDTYPFFFCKEGIQEKIITAIIIARLVSLLGIFYPVRSTSQRRDTNSNHGYTIIAQIYSPLFA